MNGFHLRVVSVVRTLFNDQVESVFLLGDEGEFELLAHHYPLMGALTEGEIKIAGHEGIPIKSGVLSFIDNQCSIIIEEFQTETFVSE